MNRSLPESVREGVERLLEERTGRSVRVTDAEPVGGGCITPSARLSTDGDDDLFLKWNPDAPVEMFAAEADGLRALGRGDGPRIPEVVGRSSGDAGTSWLLMEFIPRGRPGPDYPARLAEGLARLHENGRGSPYGWPRDNFIGSLPQANDPADDWAVFWRDRRIAPQLARARRAGHFRGRGSRILDDLENRIEEALSGTESDGPSLLHGDLWGGNVFPDPEGRPVLVDPAVYRGHREVDLAMSQLFGFPAGFLAAYRDVEGVDEAYDRVRRPLYQLYYLLVHVNLFGSSYVDGCLRAARSVLAEV